MVFINFVSSSTVPKPASLFSLAITCCLNSSLTAFCAVVSFTMNIIYFVVLVYKCIFTISGKSVSLPFIIKKICKSICKLIYFVLCNSTNNSLFLICLNNRTTQEINKFAALICKPSEEISYQHTLLLIFPFQWQDQPNFLHRPAKRGLGINLIF